MNFSIVVRDTVNKKRDKVSLVATYDSLIVGDKHTFIHGDEVLGEFTLLKKKIKPGADGVTCKFGWEDEKSNESKKKRNFREEFESGFKPAWCDCDYHSESAFNTEIDTDWLDELLDSYDKLKEDIKMKDMLYRGANIRIKYKDHLINSLIDDNKKCQSKIKFKNRQINEIINEGV